MPVRPRIMGLETEHALIVTKKGEPYGEFFEAIYRRKEFLSCLPIFLSRVNQYQDFYSNGARIYFDSACRSAHLEYATPEALGPKNLLMYEKAGEKIVEETVQNAHATWEDDGIAFRIFKNNLDTENNSYGAHENYLLMRKKRTKPENLLWPLGLFLAARPMISGNGWLYHIKRNMCYRLSQRANMMFVPLGICKVESRPLINTIDDPMADEKLWRRLELVCGDSLMCETARLLQFGTTDIVLDMIEEKFLTRCPIDISSADPDDLIQILHAFSDDSTLRKTSRIGKKRYTILDIHRIYFDLASRFSELYPPSEERKQILELWDRMIRYAAEPHPHEHLAPYIDWAAKKCMMERKMEASHCDWKFSKQTFSPLKKLDLLFHELAPESIIHTYREHNLMHRIVSDQEIQQVKTAPLPNSRAYARIMQWQWAKKCAEKLKRKFKVEANWAYVKILERKEKIRTFKNKDPRDANPHLPNISIFKTS